MFCWRTQMSHTLERSSYWAVTSSYRGEKFCPLPWRCIRKPSASRSTSESATGVSQSSNDEIGSKGVSCCRRFGSAVHNRDDDHLISKTPEVDRIGKAA